jgi:hypothetical protein
MAKTTSKTKPTLHCQHCGKRRAMLHFAAINTEQTDGKKNIYPFHLKRFLEIVNEPGYIRLPRLYSGTCAICYRTTFYGAQNRSSNFQVIPV